MFVFQSATSPPPRASRTAEFMAFFRALQDGGRLRGRRLFADPLAAAFLRPSLRLAVRLAGLPLLGAAVPWFVDRRCPGARSSAIARTRLIDDMVVGAVRAGMDQVVLLGAGFDCRAYRLPGIDRGRVFELDHAAILAAKKARLRRTVGRLPDHVAFVEADFEGEGFAQVMTSAGFTQSARSFFVWEGVTNYLTADAVDTTLRSIAAVAAPGSRLLFTYVHRGLLDGSIAFTGTRRLRRTLRRVGEPWTFGLDPAEIPDFLASRGFDLLGDWGAVEYRARYLGERGRQVRGYEFYRAALAEVRDRHAPPGIGGAGRDSAGRDACPR